ncbi:hypothetical protein [Piscirickettsia litoralis]|uniref:Uncharacterized protein n=1 Tax=Piscirickettsia litoralis TaxID=1891921 RepID=A0ABX2ZY56_9GAMM|nr:hypothetical protein [Piscirickettsia litoralis]ODN41551.1 hypothetical protein BGC07_15700 [Piscirickettsia litoralis]
MSIEDKVGSLETEVSTLVDSSNALVAEIKNHKIEITTFVDQTLAETKEAVKTHAGSTNLFINSLFDNWGARLLPEEFFNYYNGGSRNAKVERVAVWDGNPVVESLAKLISTDFLNRAMQGAYAIKVTLDAGTDHWTLNQSALVCGDSYISQGCYLYIETMGDASIKIHDDPWPEKHEEIPKEQFNKAIKWFQHGKVHKTGGDLGFALSIEDSTAPITVYIMAPWLANGYVDHWVDSGIGSRILKSLNRGGPFVCANPNPLFSEKSGDEYFHGHNPHGHDISYEFVQPEHNEITKKLSEYLGGFDAEGNRNGMTILTYNNPRFMKVTVKRNPEKSNINFTLTGGGAHYQFMSGNMTTFIGLLGVETGHLIWSHGERTNSGDIVTNIRAYDYRGPMAKGYGHAYHWDPFNVSAEDGVDEVVYYMTAYITCAGHARYWNDVCIRTDVNERSLVGDTKYIYDRSLGQLEQRGKVTIEATTEDTFWVNFPTSFDYECDSVELTSYESTSDLNNDMWPVLVGDPEKGRFQVRFNWASAGTKKAAGFTYVAKGR